jgi:hypothetical protein
LSLISFGAWASTSLYFDDMERAVWNSDCGSIADSGIDMLILGLLRDLRVGGEAASIPEAVAAWARVEAAFFFAWLLLWLDGENRIGCVVSIALQ